ncbi:MAG TPA: hypothetical protein VEW92_14460, partial [Nitrososphaeraceae archaeon]|nr:hypothetical protein [Nitrososphaeraceae archaeon]
LHDIKDEISIQKRDEGKKRRLDFERYETDTPNRESMQIKKRKEETKENLENDNNNINKNDDNQKK